MYLRRCLIFVAFCTAPAVLTEFNGWSLLRPTSSNVVSYVTEANELLEVRAGVPYQELVLHASSNLATNASEIRAKLVFATATTDDDCLPGRASEVPNIVFQRIPVPTSLDGDTPGVTPAETYENRWVNARFPYSGAFKVCYMDLSGAAAWRLAAAPFDVVGTGANSFEFWCLDDVTVDCTLQIAGLGMKTNWYLTVVPVNGVCGAIDYAGSFGQNVSVITSEAGSESSATHSLGPPVSAGAGTFAVCFCPGYNADSSAASCTASEDFVQLTGILFVTEAVPVQNPHPQLRFTLRVHCGSTTEGGCPATTEPRIKIVDAASSNNRPAFDTLSGCRAAAQSASYMSPENCASPTRCTLPPAVASSTVPEWANLRLFPTFENQAQKPMLYDVCLCLGSCDQSANWFKAGSLQTSVIQVLPQPTVANKVLDLQLLGTQGGWSQATGSAPELKFLEDDEGVFGASECFSRTQSLQSLAGHFCLTSTDCKAPTSSGTDGHVWEDVRFLFAGMYAVCYCEQQCRSPVQWSLLEWKLVEGPSRHHSWQRYRGLLFDLTLSGFGLGAANRLAAFPDGREGSCGGPAVAAQVSVPDTAPQQLGDASGGGLLSLTRTYDGLLVSCSQPHGLTGTTEFVSFSGVTSSNCDYCAGTVNARPHRVIRLPSSTQFVLALEYSGTFPQFGLSGAMWWRSNEATWQDLVAMSPGVVSVCWSATASGSLTDFASFAGRLEILEAPLFGATVYPTALEEGVSAPMVVAFTTQNHARYSVELGESRLRLRFPHLSLLKPAGPEGSSSAVTVADATQSSCGRILREIWSEDADGFPMPKGCAYEHDATSGTDFREVSLIFSARSGLKPSTSYQLVLDFVAFAASSASAAKPPEGLLQLWAMDDLTAKPFGVIEYAPAWLEEEILTGATGSAPRFHVAGGAEIVEEGGSDVIDLAAQGNTASIGFRLRAEAGANIVTGGRLHIFFWPLTQWHLNEACAAECLPFLGTACAAPACATQVLATRRCSLRLVFGDMEPITETVQHTVRLVSLVPPPGGFFAAAAGAELRSSSGMEPSYRTTTGALLFAPPSAAGSVMAGLGEDHPFRGDRQNNIFLRLVFGASVFGGASAAAPGGAGAAAASPGFEVQLPPGYACIDAGSAAPEELDSYMTSRAMPEAPQGRGDIGLDPQIDGYWLYSGRFCMYVLRSYGVVYAGSAIVLKVVVNNPIFALPRRDPQNVWTLRLRGSTAPLAAATTALPRTGALAALADVSERLRKNVPVLGVLRDATVTPQFFGAGITRNWLSVFFTAEQGGPGNGGAVELRVPEGFSFPPSCLTQPLPAFHYATPSAQLAGTAALRSTAPLAVRRCRVGGLPNIAEVTLPSSARIAAGSTYGFEIQVFNAVQYSVGQQDGFRLTTRSAAGDDMDATYHTIRYVASDTEGPGTSFGVYQEPMPAGSFVLSFDSMLPYSESGLATRVVVFPLKVPFDSLDPVTWRLVAPLGFIWDFRPAEFLYRRQDILGVTADLPLETAPASPSTEPLAILAVVNNFQGNWDRTQTYGLVARIRVPDGTPLASSNVFLLEFGYEATTAAGRRAAASAPAPQVRALVNFHVDYFRTSLAGQQNVLMVQFQSITALPVGGSLLLDSPAGFAVEESCALQAAAVELPYQDLASTSAALLCSAFVPATTQRPQVTLRVVTGEVSAGPYVMALAARNPLVPELGGLVWRLSSFTNAVDAEVADLGSTVEGFQVESMMNFGGLLGPESGVNPATTGRDDHPGQVTNVILAFELASTPTGAGESTLTVKAPTGFSFPALCTVVVTGDVFGPGALIPLAFSAFEASAVVSTCEGGGRTARLSVAPGLIRNRRYVMRLQGVNGEETAEQNLWTISFAGEATEPFEGYRLWRFTEVAVLPDATARSTPAEETRNNVTLRFRTTSAVTSAGFVALQAPFGYVFPTLCQATLQELDAADIPIAGGVVSCRGTPLPGPTAALHPVGSSMLAALVKYQLNVVVQNPTVIALEAGTWQIQSYATKEADYSNLLDIGEAPGFHLTEVFHTLRIIYPLATPSTIDELELRMQILLSTSLEIGDVLEIVAPDGYDVTGNSTSEFDNLQRACNKFRQWSAAALPIPTCDIRVVHFEFATTGLAVVDVPGAQALTPLMDFSVTSLYPRKTLSVQATTFHGEQRRGTAVVSAKTVPGQLVTPRLLEISVVRADAFVAVQSLASLQLTFRVSQDAQALHITTEVQDAASQAEPLRFDFAAATAIVVGTEVSQVIRSNASLLLHMALEQGRGYSLTLGSVANPSTPGTALWTLTSYVLAEDGSLNLADPRDRSVNFAGPVTLNRLSIDPSSTSLTDPFFDIVNTELSLSFVAFPRVVTGGQFLVLSAPADFAFLEKSFSPGEGFPLISGQVAVVELEGSRPSYAVQILSPILPSQAVKFSVRLRTPTAPEDLSLWATTHRSNLLLQACRDSQCQDPTASNDDLFPGFEMKASFGTASITPQANGAAPQLDVTVTLMISPKATLASLIESGTVHLRIRAPLGFDFAISCLAVSPSVVFDRCEGRGRSAVLLARDGELPAGAISVPLFVTNAARTPSASAEGGVGNTWVLESFVDLQNTSAVLAAPADLARQRSQVPGYEIRDLLEATIGGNTQRAVVTTIFVWFVASQFLDIGSAVELHAPPGYELRCNPRVQYISLPAGSCTLISGVTSTTGDVFHQYLSLALTLPGQQVYPNTAYEFGVAAVNPSTAATPNFWGLVLRKPGGEVADSIRTLPGYDLTDFQLDVQTPLPSSTRPAVVSFVRVTLTFARELAPGRVAHISIVAPASTKVLCQRLRDLSGGGNSAEALPLDSSIGTYGTHTCQLQNSVTMHLLLSRPILAASYLIELGVLNPGIRAAKDFWTLELIEEVMEWRTAPAVLQIQVPGFGVSNPFAGVDIAAIANQAAVKAAALSLLVTFQHLLVP